MFKLDQVTLGVTTLTQIEARYGKGKRVRRAVAEKAPKDICYALQLGGKRAYLIFETGVMESYERPLAFNITTDAPLDECPLIKAMHSPPRAGNGVTLFQNAKEVHRRLGAPTEIDGNIWRYEHSDTCYSEPTTAARPQRGWCNDGDAWDVSTLVEAKFKRGRLVHYSVARVISC